MYEIYKDEKENIDSEPLKNKLIKSKYGLLYMIDDALGIERKMDKIFQNIKMFQNLISFKTLNEIYTLSSFVRKNIYAIQLYVLRNSVNYDNLKEITNIMLILNNINLLQEIYVDFLFDKCLSKKEENFDSKKCEDYQSIISEEVKKLELKNI